MLWLSITTIEAQEQLKAMQVADWSQMTKNNRTKIHKELFKKAFPSEIREKNYISINDLTKVLGR